ncbi:MAG: hypothetical protein F6K58_32270 [Symploca sp. SIO2E9]|nr:hypothetical protein [Symploca sp. SIO2E9]
MSIKVIKENETLTEGFQVLMANLESSKVLRFWAACHLGEGDYLKLKDQLFANETVVSLYEKVKAQQDTKGLPSSS